MAHFSLAVGPKGPILYVYVALSGPRIAALQAAGQPVPAPQLVEMLLDTGASHSSVDKSVVAALGLTPTGNIGIHTPSTGTKPVVVPTYDVGLVVQGIGGAQHIVGVHSVSECDFSAQGLGGLLGRDFMAGARLTYSGPDSFCYLSF